MRVTFLAIIVAFLGISCKSTKNLSTTEVVHSKFVMPELQSTLNVNFKVSKQAIRDTFNHVIDDYLAGDLELTALGLDVVINKIDEAQVEFAGRTVLTTLPLEIGLSKSTIISNIDAKGSLRLTFVTEMDMDSSWVLVTSTSMEHHEWLEEPKLSLGVFNIPLSKLANTIIDKSKGELEKQIDNSVSDQFTIKDKVLDLMKYVEKPILVDTILNSWVQIRPEKVYLSEIKNDAFWTQGNVTVQGKTKISSSEPKDVFPGLALPEFSWEESLDDISHVNMVMDISYVHLSNYLNENFSGKTFDNDGKEITINDIFLIVEGSDMTALVDVTGSFNGRLKVKGKPIFDNAKQELYVDNVDVSVETKNFLHKAGAWLLKGKIKNQLSQMMRFSIEDSMGDLQSQINRQLETYAIPEVLDLKADLRKINVDKFVMDKDRIHAFSTINIFLETRVHDMKVFEQGPKSRLLNR